MFRREKSAGKSNSPGALTGPGQSWKPLMAARPVRNVAAEVEPEREGLLPVSVRVDRPRWLIGPLAWVFPVQKRRTIKLDPLGRSIWELCDGKRLVADLVDDLARREQLSFHEARIAVTQYLQHLVHRGALVVVVNGQPEERA